MSEATRSPLTALANVAATVTGVTSHEQDFFTVNRFARIQRLIVSTCRGWFRAPESEPPALRPAGSPPAGHLGRGAPLGSSCALRPRHPTPAAPSASVESHDMTHETIASTSSAVPGVNDSAREALLLDAR